MAYTFNKASAPSTAQDPVFRDDVQSRIYTKAGMPAPLACVTVGVERADAGGGRLQVGTLQLTEDYSQNNDLAAKMPDKVKELQKGVPQRGGQVQRVSLDNSSFARAVTPRPSATAGQSGSPIRVRCPAFLGNAPSIVGQIIYHHR